MAIVLKNRSKSTNNETADLAGLAGFNLSDFADEGRQQLQAYRLQAEQLVADAGAEAEKIRHEAEQRGYAEGFRRGSANAEADIQASAEQRARTGLDLVRSAVAQLHEAHEQWMADYAASISDVALAATERIVRRTLQHEPQLLTRWAEDAVRSTRSACELSVAVNPKTLALLGQALDEMLASPDLPERTQIVPDENLGPTEVVVRQTGGEIQAGLIAQLRRLEELLP